MRLSAAARAFDKAPCYEAYTGALAFKAQLGLYDDNKRDSETAGRRVLSMSPSSVIPTRRVVNVLGVPFIIGHRNVDIFDKSILRVSYVAQEAQTLATVRTLQEVCLDLPGFNAYAGRAWVKNLAFSEQDSRLPPQYHIHFALGEPVRAELTVLFSGRLYIVRSTNEGGGGTLVTTCDQLEEPSVETGQLTSGVFDPITETVTASAVSARVVRIRWQSLFEYDNWLSPKMGPGDMQVALGVPVEPGAKLVLSDGDWYIASVNVVDGAYLCRATRHVGS